MEQMPKGLYDALPYLYLTVGALTAAVLDSGYRFVPAFLFFVAGVLVLTWRMSARGAKPQRRPAHRPAH